MNKSRAPARLNAQIRSEATEWLIRFSEGEVGVAGREAFNDWLRTSPEHVRAYLRVSAFWQEAPRLEGKESRAGLDALVELAKREANIFPLEIGPRSNAQGGRAAGSRRRAWRSFAIAATLLLAVGAGIGAWYSLHRASTFTTGVGEQRTVNLPDGSALVINALSTVSVRYTDTKRAIELRKGQAFFKVAKDVARPFVVQSGGSSIRAIGTQFDVYKKNVGTVVTVVEGRVAVSPRRIDSEDRAGPRVNESAPTLLSAGEQVFLTPNAAQKSRLQRPEMATAWTEGLLVFEGAPLTEVVQEYNRQNAKPLRVSGAELNRLQISGSFPASGGERLVRFLQERFGVAVMETDEEIQISRP